MLLNSNNSIDQFFECFEEMRSSQMNSGNSGIWNWTCYVFNAITFASSLTSGSDQIPGGIFIYAYESLSDGLGRSASALFGTPLKVYQHGAGARSALTSAFRAAPAAAIAPVSASARAVHCALLGLRNRLVGKDRLTRFQQNADLYSYVQCAVLSVNYEETLIGCYIHVGNEKQDAGLLNPH
uniref:Autophagy-related protein 2 n=1 Tax=Ananas comosus var. bracteatus TaxID=296719 RepID=A0A6V7PY30_ANACO|nr:unnamed protein product [Ananas comosus var. bracteatus]